jgi:hypothetical protein
MVGGEQTDNACRDQAFKLLIRVNHMAPCRGICREKVRLRQQFLAALSEVERLEDLHLRTPANSVEENSLAMELQRARTKRYFARDALLAHVRGHGCKE